MEDPHVGPDLAEFWRLLAEGLCAGQPLLPTLRGIAQRSEEDTVGRAAAALADSVRDGATLSQAMGQRPAVFTDALVSLVAGGEALGIADRVAVLILESTWRCPACGNTRGRVCPVRTQTPADPRCIDMHSEE